MDKLSRDAMRARQAGMSYGKWKALQGDVQEPETAEEDELPEGWRKCKFCGEPFFPETSRMIFCGKKCRVKSYAPKDRIRGRERYWQNKAKRGAEDG